MRRRIALLLIFFGLGALIIGAPSRLSAQEVKLSLEADSLVLTYTKVVGTHVTVQFSTDLGTWFPTYPLDEIQSENNGMQTVRSSLAAPQGEQFFFRLLVSPTWQVSIAWDPVGDPEVAGYHVYYHGEDNGATDGDNREQQIDAGNATSCSVLLPVDRRTYHFAVASYSSDGLESDRSQEIQITRGWLPF